MGGTFVDRIQVLRDNIGGGHLTGRVVVDQVYAGYQEFLDELHHPDGGKAHFLRDGLYSGHSEWLDHFATKLLEDEGRGGSQAMMDNMEGLARKVYEDAPWEFADLRASGHPSVEHNGAVVHDRPAYVARLSESELREKGHLSHLLDPRRYKR